MKKIFQQQRKHFKYSPSRVITREWKRYSSWKPHRMTIEVCSKENMESLSKRLDKMEMNTRRMKQNRYLNSSKYRFRMYWNENKRTNGQPHKIRHPIGICIHWLRDSIYPRAISQALTGKVVEKAYVATLTNISKAVKAGIKRVTISHKSQY